MSSSVRTHTYPFSQSHPPFLTIFFFILFIRPAGYNGSISAEHGIGAMKTHAIHYSKSGVAVDMMKRIKNLFDPRGIMNPGKVLE